MREYTGIDSSASIAPAALRRSAIVSNNGITLQPR